MTHRTWDNSMTPHISKTLVTLSEFKALTLTISPDPNPNPNPNPDPNHQP